MEYIDSCIPQKPTHVGFSDNQCALCKKNGGPYKSHNTRDCRKFNPVGTPIKRNGGTWSAQRNGHVEKHCSKERECEGANFAQIICKEVRKACRKQSHKHKTRHANNSESDSNSNYSSWSHGSDSKGESSMCKKCKLNISVNDNT